MPDYHAADIERMLAHARVRNFKATFDVERPDGSVVPIEMTMPEGRLKQENGRGLETDDGYIEVESLRRELASKFVVQLRLYPVPSLNSKKQMIVRVVE